MSNKKIKYRQCELVKNNTIRVSWIPERFAIVNNVVKIKDKNDNWDDGWIIQFVSETSLDEIEYPKTIFKKHKEKTGDSLPKNE